MVSKQTSNALAGPSGPLTRSRSANLLQNSATSVDALAPLKRTADAPEDENVPRAAKRPKTEASATNDSSPETLDDAVVRELLLGIEGRVAAIEEELRELQSKSQELDAATILTLTDELAALHKLKAEQVAALSASSAAQEKGLESAAASGSQPVASGSDAAVERPLASGSYVMLDTDVQEDQAENFPDDDSDFLTTDPTDAVQASEVDDMNDKEVRDALDKLGVAGLCKQLPGMKVALMPHQAIGVAWMLNKEKGKLQGGCLADDMGLGKTVQMIAVMVLNRSEDPKFKINLIVAPVALLGQWQLEIETKTDCGLKCLIYHGSKRPKDVKQLLKYDVILTTFGTLVSEWSGEGEELKLQSKSKKAPAPKPVGKKKDNGPLFKIQWYRAILDEAQNIRNKDTRASRAASSLKSKYRWCLTGTPIVNSVTDAYGYLRFLRIRPYNDWHDFNGYVTTYAKRYPDTASRHLQKILDDVLLRRKKDATLGGRPLIELPPKEVNVVRLEFTPEEREIYHMVEAKSQAIFNRFLRTGTVLKNYTQVLVMLLRLRQVCCHPCLIQEGGAALVETSVLDEDATYNKQEELNRAKALVSADFVKKMLAKFLQIAQERVAAEKESADAVVEVEECPICFDLFTNPVVTPCGHVYCKDCMRTMWEMPLPESDSDYAPKYKKDERPCPVCRGAVSRSKVFERRAFEPSNAELGIDVAAEDAATAALAAEMGKALAAFGAPQTQNATKVSAKKAGKAPQTRQRAPRTRGARADAELVGESDSEERAEDDDGGDYAEDIAKRTRSKGKGKARAKQLTADLNADADAAAIRGVRAEGEYQPKVKFLPSTKMKWMMESLSLWAQTHPGEKTIVISQWTGCLRLLSEYLTANNILHVQYDGAMTRDKRDQAVRVFMTQEKATVMLLNLKCGGVGLNLTRANRVISLDFGWSDAVESQAFDRVHRLGQTRPVFVHRLLIENTVEERVLAQQERKKAIADISLGDSGAKKIARLSVRELAGLFGLSSSGATL